MLGESNLLVYDVELIGSTHVTGRSRRRRTCTRTSTTYSPLVDGDGTSGRVVPVASEEITQRRYTGRGS